MLAHVYAFVAILAKISEAILLFIASFSEMLADACRDLVDYCNQKIKNLDS